MPADYFDYHPYRFQLLTAACDMRIESLRGSDGGLSQTLSGSEQSCTSTEFGAMSRAEFLVRLELATEMRQAWKRWSNAGSEILDFSSDMLELAGSKMVQLPWASPFAALRPVYVHFGSEAALTLADRARLIEGAYLETGADPRDVVIHFVCNDVARSGTVGDALIAQSEIVVVRLNRETDEFVDFDGDPTLATSAPKHAMLARVLFSIAHVLGPTEDHDLAPAQGISRLLLN
ncbi:hypothetical protein CO661_17445 [Sinorhizobium fredii]|uniref:Uncharacterized protein n=1 Tax=Rhizobium fredii TaxID=380 RepID=A0A2A6LVV2_RHIFR|nr:hypothetical protein [Sinorhizobium fredii]PDT46681.1 hypothetical protein CO661_17445 [Sinorhizobium fredii]